jgi:hypothetical protein
MASHRSGTGHAKLVEVSGEAKRDPLIRDRVDTVDRARQHEATQVHEIRRRIISTIDPHDLLTIIVLADLDHVRVQYLQQLRIPTLVALGHVTERAATKFQ